MNIFDDTIDNIYNILNNINLIAALNGKPPIAKVFVEDMMQSYYYKALRSSNESMAKNQLNELTQYLLNIFSITLILVKK